MDMARRAPAPSANELDAGDFRRRVAAEKRDRMRARLLAATMQACGEAGGPGATVIDDVIRVADVSRGAFYRHFQSLEEAVGVLVTDLIAEIVETARTVFADITDPVLGSAVGSQLLLQRAAQDRPWARFVAGTNLILDAAPLRLVLRDTLGPGLAQGAFVGRSLSAAMDVFAGGLLAGVRRLGADEALDEDYLVEVSEMLLRALGTPAAEAADAARRAKARLAEVATERVGWWRRG